MRGKKLIILVCLIPMLLNAAETMTWNKVVETSYQNNAELAGADANLRASEYQKKAIRGDFLPKIYGNLSYADQKIERSTTNFFNSNNNNNGASYSASINGSMNLFAGLRDYSRLTQAEANIELLNMRYITTKARISYDLKSSFESLTYAKEYQLLTEEIIKRRQENLKIVELRFESGLENKGSVLLSNAYLAQAKYDALQAANAEGTARAQLARAIGIDEYASFQVTGSVPLFNPPTLIIEDIKELAKSTPEFLEAYAQEKVSEKNIGMARANFFPSLDLTGSIRKIGEDYFPEDSKQSTWGLSLNIPLFDGGKDYYGTKAAMESFVGSKSNRLNVNRQLVAVLQQKYAAFMESVLKLETDTLFKDAAEVRAKIARNKYNNGLLTFENWDIIESDLINRQKSYLQSRRDRVFAQASWEQTLGKGIDL